MHPDQIKILRTKIFLRFGRISYLDLARRIEQSSGEPTNRQQVYQTVVGKMKMFRIREGLARLMGEPIENLFPEDRRRKKRAKRRDRTPSPESPSIVNPEA